MWSYVLELYHAPKMRLRAVLNGIPLYRCDTPKENSVTWTNAAAHMLVPGVNSFLYEIIEATDVGNASFEVRYMRQRDPPLYRYMLGPVDGEVYHCPPRPFVYASTFVVPDNGYRPGYLDAKPREFGLEGDAGLHAAVAALYTAMARGDADAVVELMRPKFDDLMRAYPTQPEVTLDAARQGFAKQFAGGVRATPFEPDRLVFQSCVDGRVAYVTRDDGLPPFDVENQSGEHWRSDLYLTQADGGWKFFR
ncbi:MAG TPA: nuclear transport factor 2 family protein [Byssovorax sp.]|jgi:hypothetical protein